MKWVGWWSPPGLGDKQGYGYAAVETIAALNRKGVRVDFDNEDAPVHISWVQPPWYCGRPDKQYVIGYSPWESSKLPEAWIPMFNSRDEVWTPSNYNKAVFESEGVTVPVNVVPHGVDAEHYPVMHRTLDGPFTFFHVGEPTERKGGTRVVEAFLDLFDGNMDYRLVLKSNGPSAARWRHPWGQQNISAHPQVTVYEEPIEVEHMTELYRQAHCLVYPSNGEGFGFIPFQGICTGLPTICTNGTALAEFAWRSLPLNWKPSQGEGIHLGEWCDPDLDHLRDLMRYVTENWETVRDHTIIQAQYLHRDQSWDKIGDLMLKLLGEKIEVGHR